MDKSLSMELVKLSEQTKAAYDVALELGRNEVATALVVLAHSVNALIAKTLRTELT